MAKNIKFAITLARLEAIVEKLEGSEMDLDESMKLLEEGFRLHQNLEEKLKMSQSKIEKIINSEEVD